MFTKTSKGKAVYLLITEQIRDVEACLLYFESFMKAAGVPETANETLNGSEESKQFYGITLQAEKEIIMILAGNPNRNLIMESINKEHGVNTEAGAMICSMAVEQVVRLS